MILRSGRYIDQLSIVSNLNISTSKLSSNAFSVVNNAFVSLLNVSKTARTNSIFALSSIVIFSIVFDNSR